MRPSVLLTLLALLALAGAAASFAAPQTQTFTGVIADGACAGSGHAAMRMGPTDADCTLACVDAHGEPYVLRAGDEVYALTDQKTPATFAGQRVTVVGTLDAATKAIAVQSIAAAK